MKTIPLNACGSVATEMFDYHALQIDGAVTVWLLHSRSLEFNQGVVVKLHECVAYLYVYVKAFCGKMYGVRKTVVYRPIKQSVSLISFYQ